jgi:hypothetical protein
MAEATAIGELGILIQGICERQEEVARVRPYTTDRRKRVNGNLEEVV